MAAPWRRGRSRCRSRIDVCEGASIRRDARVVSPACLFAVKAAAESNGDLDLYKLLTTVPVNQAWRSLADGGCAMTRA